MDIDNFSYQNREVGETYIRRITKVGFDLDGTLIDSMGEMVNVFGTYMEDNFGIEKDIAKRHLVRNLGKPTPLQVNSLIFLTAKPRLSPDIALSEGITIDTQLARVRARVFPEVEEVLQKLKDEGYKTYVSTSHTVENASKRLEEFGLSKYIDFVAGTIPEDPSNTKGRPHFELAAQFFGEPYEDFIRSTVLIGDAKKDMQAADGAGVMAIGRIGTFNERELMESGATIALQDFSSLPQILANLQ